MFRFRTQLAVLASLFVVTAGIISLSGHFEKNPPRIVTASTAIVAEQKPIGSHVPEENGPWTWAWNIQCPGAGQLTDPQLIELDRVLTSVDGIVSPTFTPKGKDGLELTITTEEADFIDMEPSKKISTIDESRSAAVKAITLAWNRIPCAGPSTKTPIIVH